jgi:CO/xanthine dehydrogenase Mo-binding subunit
VEDLVLKGGKIYSEAFPRKMVEISEVASRCSNEGCNLREEAWYRYPEEKYMYGHTFMATAGDVEVDLTTGQIKVLKIVNVHDTGKVINPSMAKGQLYGGTMQALGYALMEDLIIQEGYIKTPSFVEYVIPTSMDIPEEIIADFVETPYKNGPYGAKGIGEHALNSTTPAILNAISNAVGFEAAQLPVLPDQILRFVKRGRDKLPKGKEGE